MNITLYAICKNEEENVEKFIENSKKFYDTVVVDTGSTDNTVQLLRDAGITVYEHPQSREEFDFSVARNQALSYVKTDWAFSLDFNEVVEDFAPEEMDLISEDFTAFRHRRFDINDGSEKESMQVHVRFHKTKNYFWENAVHEAPAFIKDELHEKENVLDTKITIKKTILESVDKQLFYFSICERELEKDPLNCYYLAFIVKHYFNTSNYTKFFESAQKYLDISSYKSYFDAFRVEALVHSSIVIYQKDKQASLNFAIHAISESLNIQMRDPKVGDHLVDMAIRNLIHLSKDLNDPNIFLFATSYFRDTDNVGEFAIPRKRAIHELYAKLCDED